MRTKVKPCPWCYAPHGTVTTKRVVCRSCGFGVSLVVWALLWSAT